MHKEGRTACPILTHKGGRSYGIAGGLGTWGERGGVEPGFAGRALLNGLRG